MLSIYDKNIISLDEATNMPYMIAGGKFAGLFVLDNLMKSYNTRFNTEFVVPPTFGIPLLKFDEYQETNKIPDALINDAMDCVKKLGGNVAVRSSADIEDQKGKTYSGQFESVLNVKTRDQMVNAIEKVYKSAANVPNARMGIVLQQMVDNPKMAGVVYSETWYGGPFVVMNYVENALADKLLADGGRGEYFAISKPLFDENHQMIRLDLKTFNDLRYNTFFCRDWRTISPEKLESQDREKYKTHILLSALAMQLEQSLGYPIDMEFAVSADGKMNILQQRPYCLPEFYRREIDDRTTSVFSSETIVLEGTVGFIKRLHPFSAKPEYDINIWKSEESIRIFTNKSVGVGFQFMVSWSNSPFEAQYNHHGNMSRENLDFTELELWGRNAEFENIEEGDRILVDMYNGKVKLIAKANERQK
ncbi:MAG: hypothetical protein J6W40_03650 [Alphaproteobacteria bacterium]|nr:hypothetical protein [Alphaproteobacteria bacterium]